MIFDIITFIIAIVSFGLSLWNFIETRLNNRVNLSVECKDFIIAEHFSRQPLYIALSLINKSQLPISISRAFIIDRGDYGNDYYHRKINGVDTPVSKPDGDPRNNLG